MVEMKQSANNAQQTITDEQLNIILDALLHEMERHNTAENLVNDETARDAIKAAKAKIYRTYQVFCKMITDDEI